jgi:hypothetical protein
MMAQWRTAFKLTQDDVVVLADKINYLGIPVRQTRKNIGNRDPYRTAGRVAGWPPVRLQRWAPRSRDGVESEIASTGIKNFMLSLTAGNSATKAQKQARLS